MRTPPIGDSANERTWQVLDHALPLPFDIGQIGANDDDSLISTVSQNLNSEFMAARKHQAFRAVNSEVFFLSNRSDEYTNSRLIGRSVENSRWVLVIPGLELLNDPDEGIQRFINSVSDIKIHFHTYSHAGN